MATLNLVLDKRRVKKDCTYPVVFRLIANRKQAFIPTGISINEHAKLSKEEWLEFENSPTKLLADLEVTSCCEL
jgi:hypothetical protein